MPNTVDNIFVVTFLILRRSKKMEVGCTAVPMILTSVLLTYPIASRVCGVIYLILLRVTADAASFDRGMLSVSWGVQCSAFFFLPVNSFFFGQLA